MIKNVMSKYGTDSHLTAGRKKVIEIMMEKGMTHATSGRQEYILNTNPTGETTHTVIIQINERRTIGEDVKRYADYFIFDHVSPHEANTPEQEHYLQIGLANLAHCDTEHNIGYTFEDCPACNPIKFTTSTETGRKDAMSEIAKWMNDEPSFEMVAGEGAPQYTFSLPAEPTQLALL